MNFIITAAGLLAGSYIVNDAEEKRKAIKARSATLTSDQDLILKKLPALKQYNEKQCQFLSTLGSAALVFSPAIGGQTLDNVGTVLKNVRRTLNFIIAGADSNKCS